LQRINPEIENAGCMRPPPMTAASFCHSHHQQHRQHNTTAQHSPAQHHSLQPTKKEGEILRQEASSRSWITVQSVSTGGLYSLIIMSSSTPTSSSPPLKTNASSKLYVVFIIGLLFCITTFFLIGVSQPDHHANSPHHERQKTMLDEFLDSGKPALKGSRPVTGITPTTTSIKSSSSSNTASNTTTVPYHMIFSTSCIDQQHWESYVFYYHAFKVQQPGTVTRIVSGCTPHQATELQTFHDLHIQPMSPHFHLHMTPDFSRVLGADGKYKVYKYMNKPFGLRHWMQNVLKMNDPNKDPKVEDGIVMLLDPDMILLRPLVHDFTNENVIFLETNPATRKIQHGFPISQQDGYMSSKWMNLNITYITNGEKLPAHVTRKSAPLHWNTGPPYLATVKDMYQIAKKWTVYAPRVLDVFVGTFSEMFGFILSTTQLNLAHTMIKSIVISTTSTADREGWAYIDAIPANEICLPPTSTSATTALPVGLHYCGRHGLDTWFFSKYRLKKKYISCETPFLTPPPTDLATLGYDYLLPPPPHGHKGGREAWKAPKETFSKKQAKREAYMVCGLIGAVNEAARYFKVHACNGTANMKENYNFHDDPHH
jgi:hypothetical protein